jgi:hypothetical protein
MIATIFIFYFTATVAYLIAHYLLTRRNEVKEKVKDYFEIHVLVDPKLQSILQKWVDSNKKYLIEQGFLNARFMATRTSVGVSKTQPMVTCLVKAKNHAESIELTKKLSKITKKALESEGIVREKSEGIVREKSEGIVREKSEGIVREKSEGIVREKSEGIVREKSEGIVREKSEGIVREKSEGIVREKSEKNVKKESKELRRVFGTGYFESHCKVTNRICSETGKVISINTVEEWQRFAKLCASSAWTDRKISVPLLSNFDSAKGPYPVTTLRMYETDLNTFLQEHDKFIAFLKEQGYQIMNPHIEESQFDNNPFTDLDWAIFPRYPDAYKDYILGSSFNECFRWCEPQDFTEEAYNPPEGWLEQVTAFESTKAT